MEHIRAVPDGVSDADTPSGAPARASTSSQSLNAELSQLFQLCSRGDEGAFARIYDATSSRAYGLALRVVRNPAHAEEIVQEAYLDAWRNSSRFDPARGSAMGWLLTIVHRKAVDRVRSAEAATQRDVTYERETRPFDHDQTAETAQSSLEAQRVRGAVATLTVVQREAVELAFFGGYTHTEVANLLDVPVGTAKTRIRDGLIRLRDAMGVGS